LFSRSFSLHHAGRRLPQAGARLPEIESPNNAIRVTNVSVFVLVTVDEELIERNVPRKSRDSARTRRGEGATFLRQNPVRLRVSVPSC